MHERCEHTEKMIMQFKGIVVEAEMAPTCVLRLTPQEASGIIQRILMYLSVPVFMRNDQATIDTVSAIRDLMTRLCLPDAEGKCLVLPETIMPAILAIHFPNAWYERSLGKDPIAQLLIRESRGLLEKLVDSLEVSEQTKSRLMNQPRDWQ